MLYYWCYREQINIKLKFMIQTTSWAVEVRISAHRHKCQVFCLSSFAENG